jgi:8-amino-7-oxononanoate synthase
MGETDIAIIGVGARYPGAADIVAFRDLAWAGRVVSGPVPADRWDHARIWTPAARSPNRTPSAAAAFMGDVTGFAPAAFGITPHRARVMDPQQRLMLETTRQALENAGYAGRRLAGGRVGVYVGASSSDHRELAGSAVNLNVALAGRFGVAPDLAEAEIAAALAALPAVHGYTMVGQQLNMIAANVSQAWDFHGPAFAVDTACSSALAALHEAAGHLRAGEVDAAVVGGVYVLLDPCMMVGFSRIGALSPTDAARPFQAGADGFMLGEGVGVVVLKRLADARRDDDAVVAVIRGVAMNNDGAGGGPLTPRQGGQEAVMRAAWRAAGLDPATAGLAEAHGTATPRGDGIELAALQAVLAAGRPGRLPVVAIKANIGHGLASAGMASLLRAALAVQEGVIPPQPLAGPLRAEFSDGRAAGLRIPEVREDWPSTPGAPRRAGVSAFGFGGTNVHVVLEQAGGGVRPAPPVTAPSRPVEKSYWLIDAGRRSGRPAPEPVANPEAAPARAEEEVQAAVVAAVAAVTAWSPAEIRPGQTLAGDLGFDSLTAQEFSAELARRLPGRTLGREAFSPALTVGGVVRWLVRQAPETREAARGEAVVLTGSWLRAHRPGGVAVAPLAALWRAAAAGGPLVDFAMERAVRVEADGTVRLRRELTVDGTVELTAAAGLIARARAGSGSGPEDRVEPGELAAGGWTLERFYAEAGFHDEPIRSLAGVPRVGAGGVAGGVRADRGPEVALDGLLQLALYWLATWRGERAVATGVAEGWVAGMPAEGGLEGRVRLAAEGEGEWRGDAELVTADGRVVASWRGVRARRLAPAAETGPDGWPEVRALRARRAALTARWRMPYFQTHDGSAGGRSRMEGREVLNFSSYNYLALAGDARVNAAAAAAVARYGTSVSASRMASGERPCHTALERALAEWLGCEDALALVSGHATNVAVIGHLFGSDDLVLHDALAHDCIVAGARLAGARRIAFPHNDAAALARLLEREGGGARRTLIAVEGVYSMDGDVAPLAELVALKERHGAFLLVDEAHSLGVLGATGRGVGEHAGVAAERVDLWMGTLSKALASCGGYLAGRRDLIDYLRFTLPGFVYSVGLPPAAAEAGRAALALLAAEPERVARLRQRADFFRAACRSRGLEIGAGAHSAVVPVIAGEDARALDWAQALGDEGINVQPILHPAVEPGRARLRFFIACDHSEEDLRRTADAVARQAGMAR